MHREIPSIANNCPLAEGCRDWHRYQRDQLLRELVTVASGYKFALLLLSLAGQDKPAPFGYEHGYLIARQIHKLGVQVPASKPALSKMLRCCTGTATGKQAVL
jgi:hypothetical protein